MNICILITRKTFSSTSDHTLMMIDRYKYFDLLPCSSLELKAMGYLETASVVTPPVSLKQLSPNGNGGTVSMFNTMLDGSTGAGDPASGAVAQRASKKALPVPDVNQMIPFKPTKSRILHMPGFITGGVFSFPPAVNDLVKRLPPPNVFEGPFVVVDELIKVFQQLDMNEFGKHAYLNHSTFLVYYNPISVLVQRFSSLITCLSTVCQ